MRDVLTAARVVPILRTPPAGSPLAAVAVLASAGFPVVELTMTSPDPFGDVAAVRAAHPQMIVGLGSITMIEDLEAAVAAGASFVVTPVALPSLVVAARELSIPIVPGATTPTEVHAMHRLGAEVVKVFPAGRFGPGYLRDLLGPMPDVRLVATGGVGVDDVLSYLDAGAVAVGLGSDLIGDACGPAGDLEGLQTRSHRVFAVLDDKGPRRPQRRP